MTHRIYGVVIRTNDPFVALAEVALLEQLAIVQFGWAEYWRAAAAEEGFDPAPPHVAVEMRARADDWSALGEATTQLHDQASLRGGVLIPPSATLK